MWSKCNGMGKKGGSVKKVVKTKAYPSYKRQDPTFAGNTVVTVFVPKMWK